VQQQENAINDESCGGQGEPDNQDNQTLSVFPFLCQFPYQPALIGRSDVAADRSQELTRLLVSDRGVAWEAILFQVTNQKRPRSDRGTLYLGLRELPGRSGKVPLSLH